jgi:hypothetical protein
MLATNSTIGETATSIPVSDKELPPQTSQTATASNARLWVPATSRPHINALIG